MINMRKLCLKAMTSIKKKEQGKVDWSRVGSCSVK